MRLQRLGILTCAAIVAIAVMRGFFGPFPTTIAGFHSTAFAQEAPKSVLVLSSSHSGLPAAAEITKGILRALQAGGGQEIGVYNEYLDSERFPGVGEQENLRRFLGEKYANRPIDVVMVLGPQALEFMRAYGDQIFPDVPVVYSGVRSERIRHNPPPPNFVGIESRFDLAATVNLALALQPEAKELIVVTGAAQPDKAWEVTAKAELAAFADRLTARYLSGLTIDNLLTTVAQLPRDSIVLYLTVHEDGAGRGLIPRDVAARLSQAASAPIYSVYDTFLGQGIVGGYMDTFEAVGVQAGSIAHRILEGERPAEITVDPSAGHAYRVDWRQLQRWGLDAANLPADAEIRYRPPSLWEQNRELVLTSAFIFALQSLLILTLLIERHRRHRAEGNLREGEERIALAAQSANLGLWQWDIVRDRLWTTDLCRVLLGIASDKDLSMNSLFDAVSREDRKKLRKTIDKLRSTDKMSESEFRVLSPNGDTRWIGAIGRASFDHRGKAVRMTGVLTDLTERKQAEEAIRESEERYRVVAETASDGIITIDHNSVIVFANQAAEKIFGHSISQMVGSELTMLMPNHLRHVHRTSLKRYLESGKRRISWEGVELLGLHRDGSVIPLELSFAEYVSNGEHRFTGIVRNVSERKRAEEKLRESEERYRNVVETQTELICRYLPDTTLTFVNDTYCRYFGKSREELIGNKFIEFMPESARASALGHIESIWANAQTETYEHEVLRPDGNLGWQQWVDSAILDSTGKIVEIQGIGRDITELKDAESEARQRREEVMHLTRVAVLGELSGALAHELNQPLAAILSNAQAARRMLGRDSPNLGNLAEILNDIVADDNRAGAVIQRLRALLQRGDRQSAPQDINEIVTDVLQFATPELVARRVTVEIDLAPSLPIILGDRIQLQQVLLNLVLNGCEAMIDLEAPARRLTITTSKNGEGLVETRVSDHGTGIESSTLERIFEPFVTTKKSGLGLGLSICRSIITAHGGRIWAHNNPDRGATFGFAIPGNEGEDSADQRTGSLRR